MTRTEELKNIFKNIDENQKKLINNEIDELVFLENRLKELRKLPFIRVHPKNSEKQESTKASKMYKDLSQIYDNKIKIFLSLVQDKSDENESPFKQYLIELRKKYE